MSIVSQLRNTRLYGKHKEAVDFLACGRPRDAISILAELARADTTNHFVCIDMGYALMQMGMPDKAIVAARQAIELESNSVEAFLLLAGAQTAVRDYKSANVALLRAVDLLRNPFRTEEEFLRQGFPKPLVIADFSAIFVDFAVKGEVNNLSLKAVSHDRKLEFILKIAISDSASLSCDTGYEQVGSGKLERKRLLQNLTPEVAGVVEIFPSEAFEYAIFKKVDG